MYDYKFKVDFKIDETISSARVHRTVLSCAGIHHLDGKLVCNEVATIISEFLFYLWIGWYVNLNYYGEKQKNILIRNIEGLERRARTWRPGRETTSPALGWFKNSYRNRFRLVWCILLVHRCEMYTEILSPSFVGMTFNQASVLCFSKVPHIGFSSSQNWIDDERYLFSLNYCFLPSRPSRTLVKSQTNYQCLHHKITHSILGENFPKQHEGSHNLKFLVEKMPTRFMFLSTKVLIWRCNITPKMW